MPLTSQLTSRTQVQKFDENQPRASDGKWTAGGGGRQGGTAGSPKEDAFGNPLKIRRGKQPYEGPGEYVPPKNMSEARAMAKQVVAGYHVIAAQRASAQLTGQVHTDVNTSYPKKTTYQEAIASRPALTPPTAASSVVPSDFNQRVNEALRARYRQSEDNKI